VLRHPGVGFFKGWEGGRGGPFATTVVDENSGRAGQKMSQKTALTLRWKVVTSSWRWGKTGGGGLTNRCGDKNSTEGGWGGTKLLKDAPRVLSHHFVDHRGGARDSDYSLDYKRGGENNFAKIGGFRVRGKVSNRQTPYRLGRSDQSFACGGGRMDSPRLSGAR